MASSNMTASKRAASAVVGTLLGVAVVATVGLTLHSLSTDPTGKIYATKQSDSIAINGTTYPKASLTLGVYPDRETALKHGSAAAKVNKQTGYPQYGPSTHIVLPAHTYVTMTIHVYDSGEELNNPYFGKVVGTVGGTATYDGVTKPSIPADTVEHTFTLHGLPTRTQDPLFVNVPLPKVETKDNGDFIPTTDPGTHNTGHTVTFSFLTGSKGNYVWNCEYPCGDGTYRKFGGVMSAYGYMSGKVTVA
jgi:hypothetical protein